MAGYYYLISSLPLLMFDERLPLTVADFTAACAGQLTESDQRILNRLTLIPEPGLTYPAGSAAERWRQWEICLRNRIASRRIPHGKDIHRWLQDEAAYFGETDPGVQEAFALKNPLEREKYLDRLRWRALDDFEAGHHFDFDKLCIYKLKLLLLAKWNERRAEQGGKNLDAVLEGIDKNFEE
ncbi:MAG: DUF2764 family protein [Victivallaceae bacterium]|nr:DUF2764 family protein [Victivallaceae bacterium]